MNTVLQKIFYKLGYTYRYNALRKIYVPDTTKDTYCGKPLIKGQAANDLIAEKVKEGKPLMVARIGAGELATLYSYFTNKKNPMIWDAGVVNNLQYNAGFFSADPANLERFCKEMFEHLRQVDIMGVWHNEGEEEICAAYCPNASFINLESIEPYYYPDNPWSQYLAGKKVLVVHPFQDSITYQYNNNRRKLFPNELVLPEFELKTIKAVQSITGIKPEFATWFDAYQHMCGQINNTNFDVAIIGAGAYGLPLAGFVKSIGKQAIHMGGATQIMFGVYGNRWLDVKEISKFFNDKWKKPYPHETPKQAATIEGACYW
ncbi:MAG: hypothetical protein P4L41_14340 [Flavipsychrobacter sp.]|nr:hypothetical protein [Flavipsychrobacter sp.]